MLKKLKEGTTYISIMAELLQLVADMAEVKSSLKSLAKLMRKLRTGQDDPDGEKAKARASNNGFNRPLEVSEKLRTFLVLGEDEMISRSEVTRRINTYVTTNNLKQPDNGRNINLDDKMKELLEPPADLQITFLNIQKYLSPHYVKVVKEKVVKEKKLAVVVDAPVATDEVPPATPKVKRPAVKKAAVKA